MASSLGKEIRRARLKAGIGLRELARRIEKSPAYVVALERAEESPGVTEETLAAIAAELSLNADALMTLASKVPAEVKPKTPLEVELYRRVRQLSVDRQRALLEALKGAEAEGEADKDKKGGKRDRR
jgi:transcriptional regulator with XRE-family HTH domain